MTWAGFSIPQPLGLVSLTPASSPGFDVVEEVVPALVDLQQRAADLRLLGGVTGQQELLAELLQVALVLTEQVDFLHAVLRRGGGATTIRKKTEQETKERR